MENNLIIQKGVSWCMYNPIGRMAFTKAYNTALGKTVCASCPSELYKAFFEFKNHIENQNKPIMPNKKYQLKPGVLLQVKFAEVYSNDTITDEIAERLLNQNPQYAKYFEPVAVAESKAEAELQEDQETE
jgi:hypothetical protein